MAKTSEILRALGILINPESHSDALILAVGEALRETHGLLSWKNGDLPESNFGKNI